MAPARGWFDKSMSQTMVSSSYASSYWNENYTVSRWNVVLNIVVDKSIGSGGGLEQYAHYLNSYGQVLFNNFSKF